MKNKLKQTQGKNLKVETKERGKIITLFFSVFFFILILFGSIFGLLNFNNPNDYQIGNNFKNYYQFEVSVEWKDQQIDRNDEINQLADYFNQQLSINENYYDSEVYVVDDDTILIDMPIISIQNGNYGDDLLNKPFSDPTQQALLQEVIYLQATLINQDYLEFRSYNGELLFPNGDQFVAPPIASTDDVSTDLYSNLDATTNQGNLIDTAEVDYYQGNPYIKIYPKDATIFRDAITWYQDQAAQATSSDPNSSYWTIWFDYDQLENILLKGTDNGIFDYIPVDYDPSGEQVQENVYTYTHTDEDGNLTQEITKKIAEPYFVTIGQPSNYNTSVYNDYFAITGDFSVAKANNIVRRINFSDTLQYFDLSISNYNLVYNQNSINDLGWMFWLFITFVLLVGFFFVFWFGLLGLIATGNNLLFAILFSYFIYLFSLPISFALLSGLFLIVLITSWFSFYILKKYKDIDNKLWNAKTKYQKIMKDFSITFLPLLFVVLVSFLIGGFFLPIFPQIFIYFLVFAILFFLLVNYLILPLVLFFIDWATNFTNFVFTKEDQFWNYFIGFNDKKLFSNKKQELLKVKKNNNNFKFIIILTLISSVLFGAVFAINYSQTNSGLNKGFLNDSLYQYDIVKTYQTSTKDTYASYNSLDNQTTDGNARLEDPQNQAGHIDELNDNIDQIIETLKTNNVKIDHYQIIRYDKLIYQESYKPDENQVSTIVNYDYQFTYGISVYSDTKITSEMFVAINNDLYQQTLHNTKDEKYNLKYAYYGQLQNSPYYYDYDYYYQLIPTSSISIEDQNWKSYYKDSYENNAFIADPTNPNVSAPSIYFNSANIVGYSVNDLTDTSLTYQSLDVFIAILLIFLSILFFGAITYRFALTLAILATLLIEVIFTLTLTLLLFTPFANVIVFALLISIFFSLFAKLLLVKRTKDQEFKFKDNFILFLFQFIILNLLISLFAIIIIGKIALITLIYLLIFSIIEVFTTIFVFPTIVIRLDQRFKNNKKRRKDRDHILSKQDDVVIEEIIEGIND
ncbi:MAG: hypothetical protein HPPSJP_4150 [Candidatus Hepatoplasma scabrum]|nr:MAG: hypothetical protein HPPSJP_4150 [Candidatus Hepatoplasma sp.]